MPDIEDNWDPFDYIDGLDNWVDYEGSSQSIELLKDNYAEFVVSRGRQIRASLLQKDIGLFESIVKEYLYTMILQLKEEVKNQVYEKLCEIYDEYNG